MAGSFSCSSTQQPSHVRAGQLISQPSSGKTRKLWRNLDESTVKEERRANYSENIGDISVVCVYGVTHHSPPHGIKKNHTGGKATPGEVSIHPLLLSLSNNLVSTVCICIYNEEERDNPAALVCVRTLSWSRLALY